MSASRSVRTVAAILRKECRSEWRTRWGYEIRATGASPAAARYGGIATGRQIVLAMALSGALAGMVAISEVLGYRYRYYDSFSAGYGFTGIAVALLGRNHPLGVVIAAALPESWNTVRLNELAKGEPVYTRHESILPR